MMEQDPTNCITPPETYRRESREVLADRVARRAAMCQIESEFHIPKPYTVITKKQVQQLQAGLCRPRLWAYSPALVLASVTDVPNDRSIAPQKRALSEMVEAKSGPTG